MSLLQTTRTMLKKHTEAGNTLRQLAEQSGGSVEYEWLVRFARGEIKNPGVIGVQNLHDHLKSSHPRRDS